MTVVHLQLSNHEQAIEDFGKSSRLDPEQRGPYAGRGDAYSRLGLTDKAQQDFDKVRQLGD